MTTIIQDFTLVSLNSNIMLYPVELSLGAVVLSLSMHLSPYVLVSLRTQLLIMARKDGKEKWQRRIIISHPTHLTTYSLNSLLPTQSKSISGCGNYLCFVYLLKNEVIISRASLDDVEFERSVGHNRIRSSFV